jgi:4-hydroxyacetophenone monooxygenase
MPTSSPSNPFACPTEPIIESREEVARFLEQAEVPPLLPALAYLTGDLSLLRDHLRPDPLLNALPQGGLTDEQQAEVRGLVLDALMRFKEGGCVAAPSPSPEDLIAIMEFAVSGSGMANYLPLLEEELSFRGEDRRAPGWHKSDLDSDREFRVAIIGAGMSGLLMAHRLAQAGVDFVILEKNQDVGGTWLENTYPGCRVDNPNHNYSYSFAQRHDWPFHFSTQDVLYGYLKRCAEAFGLIEHIEFSTEVRHARWDQENERWHVTVRSNDGDERTIEVDALVSAVGQLNQPLYPNIEGMDSFEGSSFHSARWDHSIDLHGKRVGVIGTGASSVQFIPEIAKEVGELFIFQRTPGWFVPTPDYHDEVPEGQKWLYTHVPSYSEWNRFWIFWRMGDGVIENVRVDPAYEPKTTAVSGANEMVRMMLQMYLELEFSDRPDLLSRLLPSYPPGAKRLIRDNGIWATTLKRENVQLVTDPIAKITEKGILNESGEEFPLDVIIYGTGFQASHFLTPMTVTGVDGLELHEQWGEDARAYLGVTVPNFPNLFCLYGPNTNIVINGSIVYFSECGVRYIVGLVRLLLEGHHRSLEVLRDVHDQFNAKVDLENQQMAWGWSDVNSWYKSASGRISQNWPFTLLDYWERTREPDPAQYQFSD